MTTRAPAALTVFLLILASCGGRQDVSLERPSVQEGPASIQLPDPIPAAPAWVAALQRPASSARIRKASRAPGLAVLASMSVRRVTVRGPEGKADLRVAAVDPLPFRSVAPATTRDAEFVWTALMSNRAVMTFDAARRLGVVAAQDLVIESQRIQVGAFADNGTPNLADILVSAQVARQVNLGGPRLLVVGAKDGAVIEKLGRALEQRLPGAKLRRIQPSEPARRTPEPTGAASGATIGTMNFRILKNGFIDPDPAWVAANIATGTVPILGAVRCHRLMFDQLGRALQEIADAGLAEDIRPDEYAGCYVPRFINRDPRRSLSMHAFGLAIDLNTSTNRVGTRGDMPPEVVAIFQKWGFAWGGDWSPPDPMHFELARIIQPTG